MGKRMRHVRRNQDNTNNYDINPISRLNNAPTGRYDTQGKADDHASRAISYDEAIAIIEKEALEHAARRDKVDVEPRWNLRTNHAGTKIDTEEVAKRKMISILGAVGRIITERVVTPFSTPRHDTSAMDGYVVCSESTSNASPDQPISFKVVDVIVAGSRGKRRSGNNSANDLPDSTSICAEIMTGARFPEANFPTLDAVVKWEDVTLRPETQAEDGEVVRYIDITRPVAPQQNRRKAGTDLKAGQMIVERGSILEPKHIMALASIGIYEVEVLLTHNEVRSHSTDVAALKVGVLSTGSELLDTVDMEETNYFNNPDSPRNASRIPDSNGPYLVSALKMADPALEVTYAGTAYDTTMDMITSLGATLDQNFDVVITSGGVSMGRCDFIRKFSEIGMCGRNVFHGVKIRPGLPVLYNVIDNRDYPPDDHPRTISGKSVNGGQRTAIFGLPGNPIAAAACLQFFVIPYLSVLRGGGTRKAFQSARLTFSASIPRPNPSFGLVSNSAIDSSVPSRKKPDHLTVFFLGRRTVASHGYDQESKELTAEILEDQASFKVSTLLQADCWIVAPAGTTAVSANDQLALVSLV